MHLILSYDIFLQSGGHSMSDKHDRPYRATEGRREEDSISRNLKRVYDNVASEPLPDTLQSLLDKLRQDGQRG